MIGTSNCVCWNENKHILALEGEKEIFDTILKPLTNSTLIEALLIVLMFKTTCLRMMKTWAQII
jgi:hypothetical protein